MDATDITVRVDDEEVVASADRVSADDNGDLDRLVMDLRATVDRLKALDAEDSAAAAAEEDLVA